MTRTAYAVHTKKPHTPNPTSRPPFLDRSAGSVYASDDRRPFAPRGTASGLPCPSGGRGTGPLHPVLHLATFICACGIAQAFPQSSFSRVIDPIDSASRLLVSVFISLTNSERSSRMALASNLARPDGGRNSGSARRLTLISRLASHRAIKARSREGPPLSPDRSPLPPAPRPASLSFLLPVEQSHDEPSPAGRSVHSLC